MKVVKYGKIILNEKEKQFIRDNWLSMTNQQLADAMGLKITHLRILRYEMGLKHMEMEYWTPRQVEFLKKNYQEIGDTELAEIFEVKWNKNKGWTKKHIEKKRRYLKLKRTRSEIALIKRRNTMMGRFKDCAKKRWETTGVTEIGEKRVWFTSEDLPFVVIKTKKGFEHYNRWLWVKHFGKIPKGMNVVITGPDHIEYSIEDLTLMSNAELAVRNSKNRGPEELKETFKLIREINKKIKQS